MQPLAARVRRRRFFFEPMCIENPGPRARTRGDLSAAQAKYLNLRGYMILVMG